MNPVKKVIGCLLKITLVCVINYFIEEPYFLQISVARQMWKQYLTAHQCFPVC